MSRILVTGANGFVGKALVRSLAGQGHYVVAMVRRPTDKIEGAGSTLVVPDIVTADWTGKLQGIDAIVHLAAHVHGGSPLPAPAGGATQAAPAGLAGMLLGLLPFKIPGLSPPAPPKPPAAKEAPAKTPGEKATPPPPRKHDPLALYIAVNCDATAALANAAAAQGVKRFVFLSSVKAAVEHTPPTGIDETLMPMPHTPYGISKRDAERELLCVAADHGMAVVILRPPLIYGPGVKANFSMLVRAVKSGIPLPFALVDNRRSLLGLSNLISAIGLALTSDKVVNRTYFLADDTPLSTPDMARAIGAVLKRKPLLVKVHVRLIREVAELLGQREKVDRLVDSLVVNSAAFRAATGWQPAPMAEELERLVASLYPSRKPKPSKGK